MFNKCTNAPGMDQAVSYLQHRAWYTTRFAAGHCYCFHGITKAQLVLWQFGKLGDVGYLGRIWSFLLDFSYCTAIIGIFDV